MAQAADVPHEERLRVLENARQLVLGEVLGQPEALAPSKEQVVAVHVRRERQSDDAAAVRETESIPFFDEGRVPVQTFEVAHPDIGGVSTDQDEVIGQRVRMEEDRWA